ncbi:MFS transporter [Inquilinus sp. YAF38]|uniref:MFS transporter n=1 Tax=Inquilinus sp. YAF38 TaxID=3233084 RepID=UPI003F8ED47C
MREISAAAVETAISNAKMGPLQYRVVVWCSLLLVFDGYDIGGIGYAVPALVGAWHLEPSAFTPAIVLGGVGMLVGSMISGVLSDRYGRKPVFMTCILVFSVFSLASALSETTEFLAATRLLTGLGLGGGLPAAIALSSDYVPGKNRTIIVGAMTAAVPVGLALGGLASSILLPTFGWQSIFVLGGALPLCLLPFFACRLPESIQIMLAKGKSQEKVDALLKALSIDPEKLPAAQPEDSSATEPGNPVVALFRDGNARRTLLLWVMFFGNFLSTWLVIFWLPTILSAAGADPGHAAFFSALLPMGGLFGVVFVATLAGRLGTERLLAIGLVVGAVSIFALWLVNPTTPCTVILVFAIGAGIQGAQFGMNGLSGSVYPARIRATGSGWAFGVGRFGNVLGPALGGVVLGLGLPPKTMLLVAVGPILIAAVAMALLGRERSAGRLDAEPQALPA